MGFRSSVEFAPEAARGNGTRACAVVKTDFEEDERATENMEDSADSRASAGVQETGRAGQDPHAPGIEKKLSRARLDKMR